MDGLPSTATVFGRPVLAGVADGAVPFWRIVLRGCSQCCFQTNEVTGAIFLIAVLSYSWKMAAFMLIGAVLGPAVALALRAERATVELGLYGFNACLMALALGNFFAPGGALWAAVALLTAAVAVVTRVLMRLLPMPVIAAPFILTFWCIWPFAEQLGLVRLEFPPYIDERVYYLMASLSALGATLFAGTVATGLLFFVGVLVSNWRHAVVAFAAATLAHIIAVWWGVPGQQINIGMAGLNAVLCSVAVYALCGSDLRLALFGAIVASAVLPMFSRLGLVPLAAGFVLVTWTVMFLGWFQQRHFDRAPDPAGGPGSGRTDGPAGARP
jgi:urea transporter